MLATVKLTFPVLDVHVNDWRETLFVSSRSSKFIYDHHDTEV